jgi:hypothetical protein
MATQPNLRIGDTERNAVAAELREHYAHGRLTLEEFNQRLDAVFASKTQGDLDRITADLPHVRSGGPPLPGSRAGRLPTLASAPPAGRGAVAGRPAAAAGTGWSGPAWDGPDWYGRGWPGGDSTGTGWQHAQRSRPRGGLCALATLLAAIASWLLVYDVLLTGLRFPWPGRVGLLLAIFTIIRSLLRRIFRGGRRR